MEEDKRAQIKQYFAPFPKWTLWIIGLGVLVFLSAGGWGARIFGLLVAGLPIFGIVQWTKKPSDEQMDLWLKEDLQNLEPRALAKSNLDSSDIVREAAMVVGPRFRNMGGAKFGYRKGKDQKARFSPVDVTVINFAEHQLNSYQCALDLTTGKPLCENVSEFFYNDIVSVSTQSDSETYRITELDQRLMKLAPKLVKSAVNGILQVNSAETFVLASSGGTKIRVVLNDPVVLGSLGGGDVPKEWAEQAVHAVLKMVREKKGGALPLRAASI